MIGFRETIIHKSSNFELSKQQAKLIAIEKKALEQIVDNLEVELHTLYKLDDKHLFYVKNIELLEDNLVNIYFKNEENDEAALKILNNLYLEESRFYYEEKEIENEGVSGFIKL